MHALIIGATGATGHALLTQLLDNPMFSHVSIFVRRPVSMEHPKLTTHIIDFDQAHTWQDKVRGDVLFCCLGTTLKDAGSQAAQWRIDYDYSYQFAQAAHAHGVSQFILVSSAFANPTSKGFYTRMKGKLEQDIRALGFASLSIFRPPSLIRPHTNRLGEKIAIRILNGLNHIGLFTHMRPMAVETLAQALIHAAQPAQQGTHLFEANDIWQLASASHQQ